jgi:hypothetical protein
MADHSSFFAYSLPFRPAYLVLDLIRFELIGNVRSKGNIMWTLP